MTKHYSAYQFVKLNGLDKAKGIVDGAPDKTATHWVFRKIPNYYSVDFQSWFHDGEWWDSDCHTEQDLIDSYGDNFVVQLNELRQAIADHELFSEAKSMFGATLSDEVVFEYFSQSDDSLFSDKGLLLKQAIKRIEDGLR